MNTTISLCMITKDEEDVIERCLSRIAHLVDEIIIVDTGSTDSTKDIARKYTEHIYDFRWTDDFSEVRNESIKKATSNWILILDADEYIEEQDMMDLRSFLSRQSHEVDEIFTFPIINFLGKSIQNGSIMETSADRLFPNHRGIFYYRPIHEQLHSTKPGAKLKSRKISTPIYHTGYLEDIRKKKDKSERNQKIFKKYKKNKSFEAYDYFTLGNEYMIIGELQKAKYYYQRALKDKYSNIAWYPYCLTTLIEVCLQLDQYTEAWNLIESKLSKFKKFPEYTVFAAIVYDQLGFDHIAEQKYLQAIEMSNEYATKLEKIWLISPEFSYKIPHRKCFEIFFRQKNINQSIYHLTKLIMENPFDVNSLLMLIQLLMQSEEANSVIQILDKLYSNPTPLHTGVLLQVSLKHGNQQLVEHYMKQCQIRSLPISPHDFMRLYLIQDDRSSFEMTVNRLSKQDWLQDKMIPNLILATLHWKNLSYLQSIDLPEDHYYAQVLPVVNSIIKDTPMNHDIIEEYQEYLVNWLTELFTLQKFETYDWLIKKINHPKIINTLANYFYNINQIDIAIDYYSILLEQYVDEIDAIGFTNLAFLHFNQNYMNDGLAFLKKAIEKAPKQHKLYIYYYLRCNDEKEKENIKQLFIDQFPQYQYLPMIKEL